MNLLELPGTTLPTTTISDAELTRMLARVVRTADPFLDVLAKVDVLGLKKRSRQLWTTDGPLDRVQDGLAWALNAADLPGTQAWDDKSTSERVEWWVHRVGALNTVAVAYPGVLGALVDRLPLQDFLGFASQAIVLCAVAREHGIEENEQKVRLLGAVLCARDLPDGPIAQLAPTIDDGGNVLTRATGVVRGVAAEVAKRPRPRSLYRFLGKLPAVGAIADYLGEYGALVRTAKAGQRWIAAHPTR